MLYTEEERQDLNKAAGLFKMAADQKVSVTFRKREAGKFFWQHENC